MPIEPQTVSLDSPRQGDYLKGLNEAQSQAVNALMGPVLVLAGAGTGKTRVLTTRIAHILSKGLARPWEILCVTFTNKAAREMRERTQVLVGPLADGLTGLGTFHSISAQILRRHAERVGLKSNFAILDDDDQLRVIKQIFEEMGIDQKKWPPKTFAFHLDYWKNKGLSVADAKGHSGVEFCDGKGLRLYEAYQARLLSLNACDFGDLLLHCIDLFKHHHDVTETYHRRYKYALVDEYQDTNIAQYLWLRLLTNADKNLCCVGDDDQSIYGWRGAEIDNILRFERDFPGAQIIRLERNYRSTQHILSAASGLIAANSQRLGKTLWTKGDPGHKVFVRGLWDGAAEAQYVADDIIKANKGSGDRTKHRFSHMAVLVRASFQMRAFEERFVMMQIPYVVVGGPRFFERAEIRDALAYLRLIASSDDDLAFERIINVPKRGIGEASVQKLLGLSRLSGQSVLMCVRQLVDTDELPGRTRQPLIAFIRDYDRWHQAQTMVSHDRLLDQILTDTGYYDMLRADKVSGAARLDNLKELCDAMKAFDSLGDFLEHVSLVMDLDRDNGGDCVRLMTLHAAKGLEFPLVYLPGWEEGVFPSQRSMDESGLRALEEERRLAYVGITRARFEARISYVANRQVYGRWTNQIPSRFVDELPPEHIESSSDTGYVTRGYAPQLSQWDREGATGSAKPYQQATSQPHRPTPTPARESAKGLSLGLRVFHVKFGYGVIRQIEGNKLVVNFETSGEKKVMDAFVDKA